ncbi:uncharacterized protein LOC115997669 isoform X1 [Ipomoea triloba]|uniref:uncharacterized protein LOC115997669 isoform X1 n=1 Tax=Ipomoea triloba TaxID=35885 RepID=UPI00125D13AA|nr:uncharacterized protein LOC115997669 isoform X1 [Ipomoea triloba]
MALHQPYDPYFRPQPLPLPDYAYTVGNKNERDMIRTLFVSGLPDDVKAREIHNLFCRRPGFESCQLKYTGRGDQDAVNLCLKRVPCPTVCNLCAKSPETVDHLLIHCEFAKKCWRNFQTLSTHEDSHLKDWIIENMNIMEQSLFCQLLVTCWKIWEVRNQKLWNNQSAHPRTVVDSARSFLEAWSTVQKPNHSPRSHSAHERWKNPPEGRLKLNVDAAINSNFKATGLGCILRNSFGEFVAARGQNWLGCYQPKLAEAISVREALKWLKERNFDNVIVETDALLVIQGLKDSDFNSSFGLILEDIRKLASVFNCISFVFVKRSANTVAHKLAREAVFYADCRE